MTKVLCLDWGYRAQQIDINFMNVKLGPIVGQMGKNGSNLDLFKMFSVPSVSILLIFIFFPFVTM